MTRTTTGLVPDMKGTGQVFNIDDRGDRSRAVASVIGFSCLVLLFLLPPIALAQAHLLQHKPFRLADTVQSGGDHICDLRRDTNGNGRPERLGDYVTTSGTVIAGPSTYETGGWLFWLREGACGILVYGEQEVLAVGDSVEVGGCLRLTNGNYFFPETGLATLGDLAIENMRVAARGTSDNIAPLIVTADGVSSRPEAYAGNLVSVAGLRIAFSVSDHNGDLFARMAYDSDSLTIYLDRDTGIVPTFGTGTCYNVTGIVVRMKAPPGLGCSALWCIAPRRVSDLAATECSSRLRAATWGGVKTSYRGVPEH
jgi:hypothetical protein